MTDAAPPSPAPSSPPVAVVTGASDGIGAAAVRALVDDGWTVAVVGRNAGKVDAVASATGSRGFVADFAVLDDVRRLADELKAAYPRIDVLANNAGAMLPRRSVTADGHETTIQVNHLAPFLLTVLLRDTLAGSGAGVVTTSSGAHRAARLDVDDLGLDRRWSAFRAYANAKLANILFARELQRRWGADGVRSVSFHPGAVASGFAGDDPGIMGRFYRSRLGRRVLLSNEQGADTLVWLASSPASAWEPGAYYVGRRVRPTAPAASDADLAARLWETSERLVGL